MKTIANSKRIAFIGKQKDVNLTIKYLMKTCGADATVREVSNYVRGVENWKMT